MPYDGPVYSERVLLHAFQWYLNLEVQDEQGRIPIMFDGYLVDPDRPKGVPAFHITVRLDWTLDEHYGAQADDATQVDSTDQAKINAIMGPVFIRFVASCFSFMEQRITIPVSRPVSRATRRRMERNHATFAAAAEVQVVELRRRERRPQERVDEGDREPPEWHVQRLVAGHWRRQYYASSDTHKPLYIGPYVKGPQDKPLKPPTSQLFVVRR